ncbi:radical SAM protein [Microvirga lotononidis]
MTLGQAGLGEDRLDVVPEPAPQSLSLNVSSSCNLACTYCYAGRGSFGSAQIAAMTPEVANAAVDRLLADARRERPVTVGFLGGEPFVNRALVHQVVAYASDAARRRGFDLRFSVTTNGTLLNSADLELVRSNRFAVTVSVDGGEGTHDRQRPSASGRGSFRRLREHIRPLLIEPGKAQVAARVTVTRHDLDLPMLFAELRELGFAEIGFAPLRAVSGRPHRDALRAEDWPVYLDALIRVAKAEIRSATAGMPLVLTNLAVALKQIGAGASSPFPCGAGGGYFSVAADGRWYACHRAVGEPDFELGDNTGLDQAKRRAFLSARHVHAKADCGACWARYLCSGGCHQEAATRSLESCDFVRGWLEFCLATACELPSPSAKAITDHRSGVCQA